MLMISSSQATREDKMHQPSGTFASLTKTEMAALDGVMLQAQEDWHTRGTCDHGVFDEIVDVRRDLNAEWAVR
jgi:hypothetical protein